jgi:hypothetical protein
MTNRKLSDIGEPGHSQVGMRLDIAASAFAGPESKTNGEASLPVAISSSLVGQAHDFYTASPAISEFLNSLNTSSKPAFFLI